LIDFFQITGAEAPGGRIMSFNVKDLSVNLTGFGQTEPSTCTGMTKTSGDTCIGSMFQQGGAAARQRNLAALKTQLRGAMARA
jgi:hypothetical protein